MKERRREEGREGKKEGKDKRRRDGRQLILRNLRMCLGYREVDIHSSIQIFRKSESAQINTSKVLYNTAILEMIIAKFK